MNSLVPHFPGSKLHVPFWCAGVSVAGIAENPVADYAKQVLRREVHAVELANSKRKKKKNLIAYEKPEDGVGTFAETFLITTKYLLKGNNKTGDIFLSTHLFGLSYKKAKEGQKKDELTLSQKYFNVGTKLYRNKVFFLSDALESRVNSTRSNLLIPKIRSIQKILERDIFQLFSEENIRRLDGCNKKEDILRILSIRVDLVKMHSMLRDMTSQQSNATSSSSEEFHTTISP